MSGVDPKLINLALLAIKRTPVDFGIAWCGGIRTSAEQNQLFKDGYSKCDGYEKLSKHQYGEAIDLNVFVGSKVIENKFRYFPKTNNYKILKKTKRRIQKTDTKYV